MALRHILVTFAILLGQLQSLAAQAHPAPMLEIHADTPTWMNGCLNLTVERINVSKQTIYLPDWDRIVFFLSTNLTHHDPSRKNEEFWLVFYGISDIVSFDANQLAAGSKTTDHFCLPDKFAVVNQREKTRRQIEVRGHVKIVASYFPTEEEWRKNKAEEEQQFSTQWRPPLEKHRPGTGWFPLQASVEILVPCLPQSECIADCRIPPPVTDAEFVAVPDVFRSRKDWNDLGKTVTDALYGEYSACKY